ncbi:MAG TPA: DUF1570 domain-containing protein [Tepidisphaeraceae bacterium]|jgi:hypothetical protein|nr:DUF1570 domain-containing protein [Tepidisphaeraceae bacterium]
MTNDESNSNARSTNDETTSPARLSFGHSVIRRSDLIVPGAPGSFAFRHFAAIVLAALFTILCGSARAQSRNICTQHYLIHTDVDDALARDLSERMEAMYGQYSQRLAAFNRSASLPRLEVYLFKNQRDYVALIGGRMKNSGGLFLPGHNLLAAFLEGQGRQQLRRTLQHEAFHQFAYNAISTDLPIWLNEGLAQFFEEGLWNGDELVLGEAPPRRVRRLQADFKDKHLLPFTTLLPMTDEQWTKRLAADKEEGARQYNQSWAMVHFLVMAQNSSGQYLYRGRLLEMLRLLHEGESPPRAFQLAFGSNVAGFQSRFVDYVRTLGATPEATFIENQGVLADMLADFAKEGRRFDDVRTFHQTVIQGRVTLHYTLGSIEWDTNPDSSVYFSDRDGNPFSGDDLYLSVHTGSPLPDIVCRYTSRLTLRTRFYDAGRNAFDHDLLIEPARTSVSITK